MKRLLAAAAFLAAFPHSAAAQGNAPLIEDGKVVVDSTDFHANLLRIPPERRGDVRTAYDRVATIVDGVFVTRSLAEKAREAGLDKDPLVQRRMQQVAEAVLADAYASRIEREVAALDLEQRARELYRADASKYVTEDQVHLQHVLVNMQGRTRDQALERAAMVAQKAKAGEDFATLAEHYSDDASKAKNRGNLGMSSLKALVEPMRKAVQAMKPGQVSDPIETEFGFHVVKLVAAKPPEPMKFEAVRDEIVRVERARLQKQRMDQLVMQVRSSPTVVVHRERVEDLVIPLPESILGGKALQQVPKK